MAVDISSSQRKGTRGQLTSFTHKTLWKMPHTRGQLSSNTSRMMMAFPLRRRRAWAAAADSVLLWFPHPVVPLIRLMSYEWALKNRRQRGDRSSLAGVSQPLLWCFDIRLSAAGSDGRYAAHGSAKDLRRDLPVSVYVLWCLCSGLLTWIKPRLSENLEPQSIGDDAAISASAPLGYIYEDVLSRASSAFGSYCSPGADVKSGRRSAGSTIATPPVARDICEIGDAENGGEDRSPSDDSQLLEEESHAVNLAPAMLWSAITVPAGRPFFGLYFSPLTWLLLHSVRALVRRIVRADRQRFDRAYVPLLVRVRNATERISAGAGMSAVVNAVSTKSTHASTPRSSKRMILTTLLWIFTNVQLVRLAGRVSDWQIEQSKQL